MATLSLDEVRERVEALAARIGAPPDALPSFGRTEDFGRPHIECNGGYHWVVVERGRERERRTTAQLDALLYWVFEAVTFEMAMRFELRHRVPDQDFRRVLFGRQIEFMTMLDGGWGVRCRARLAEILVGTPYADAGPRSPCSTNTAQVNSSTAPA